MWLWGTSELVKLDNVNQPTSSMHPPSAIRKTENYMLHCCQKCMCAVHWMGAQDSMKENWGARPNNLSYSQHAWCCNILSHTWMYIHIHSSIQQTMSTEGQTHNARIQNSQWCHQRTSGHLQSLLERVCTCVCVQGWLIITNALQE